MRVGQSAPNHHDGGWHLTGTLGSFAAATACAKLLGLDAKQMMHAIGIAAAQAGGMQQHRGTMCKSFHAGKAASNGVLAALLAQQGFDSSEETIEGKRGFARIYSKVATPEVVLDQLGKRWEITRNGHKPYACGVVLHPILDAMVALGEKRALPPEEIAKVEVRCHEMAVRITGLGDPATGLQSKFCDLSRRRRRLSRPRRRHPAVHRRARCGGRRAGAARQDRGDGGRELRQGRGAGDARDGVRRAHRGAHPACQRTDRQSDVGWRDRKQVLRQRRRRWSAPSARGKSPRRFGSSTSSATCAT